LTAQSGLVAFQRSHYDVGILSAPVSPEPI